MLLRSSIVLSCMWIDGALFASPPNARAKEGAAVAFAGTTGLAPYPGYAGRLKVTGEVYFFESGEGDWRYSFFLWDTDPECAEGSPRIRVPGACSVAVHTGGLCNETGDTVASGSGSPWLPYVSANASAESGGAPFSNGSLGAFVGRTVVVRNAAGLPVACAPLQRMEANFTIGATLEPHLWQPYPGYEGGLIADVEFAGIAAVAVGSATGQILVASVRSADPACASGRSTGVANACGIHVHEGTSCADAAAVGGHLFNRSRWADSEDPWALVRYTTGGRAKGATVMTGLSLAELHGRVLVLHDAAGARIACSQLRLEPWLETR